MSMSLDYLAGIFDGEGSVTIQRRKRSDRKYDSYIARLSVSNTSENVIKEFQNRFGGSVRSDNRGNYILHSWVVCAQIAKKAAEELSKVCYIKEEELKLLISFCEVVPALGHRARAYRGSEVADEYMRSAKKAAEIHIASILDARENKRTRV